MNFFHSKDKIRPKKIKLHAYSHIGCCFFFFFSFFLQLESRHLDILSSALLTQSCFFLTCMHSHTYLQLWHQEKTMFQKSNRHLQFNTAKTNFDFVPQMRLSLSPPITVKCTPTHTLEISLDVSLTPSHPTPHLLASLTGSTFRKFPEKDHLPHPGLSTLISFLSCCSGHLAMLPALNLSLSQSQQPEKFYFSNYKPRQVMPLLKTLQWLSISLRSESKLFPVLCRPPT